MGCAASSAAEVSNPSSTPRERQKKTTPAAVDDRPADQTRPPGPAESAAPVAEQRADSVAAETVPESARVPAHAVRVVQNTWRKVQEYGSMERLTTVLLEELSTAILYSEMTRPVAAKVVVMLDTVVGMLPSRPSELRGTLENLGMRHCAFGVDVHHYAPVCEALLAALPRVLGSHFTVVSRRSWSVVLNRTTGWMQDGARTERGRQLLETFRNRDLARRLEGPLTVVQESWGVLRARHDGDSSAFGHLVYSHLERVAPALYADLLGNVDRGLQAKIFAEMVDRGVGQLATDLPTLSASLAALGERHCRFGVAPDDYGAMTEAILAAAAEALGPDFSDEVRQAWTQVFTVFTDEMCRGAHTPEAETLLAQHRRERLAKRSALVSATWEHLTQQCDVDAIGPLFYEELFVRHPEYKHVIFRGVDNHAQAVKLVRMLAAAIEQLEQPDELREALQFLGVRHAGFGVVDADYGPVCGAFIETVAKKLGPELFTPQVRTAWVLTFAFFEDEMRIGSLSPDGIKAKVRFDSVTVAA